MQQDLVCRGFALRAWMQGGQGLNGMQSGAECSAFSPGMTGGSECLPLTLPWFVA